jgi:hypothetical protein
MKKILFILIIINIGCLVESFGQGPGYAGKKFHIKYDFQYVVPHERWNTTSIKTMIQPQMHNFQVDYAFSRLWTVGVGYGLGSFLENNFAFEKNAYEIKDLGLYIRRYALRSGSIAPIGTYIELSGHRLNINNRLYTIDYLDEKNTISETPYQFNAVSLGIGRQALFFKEGITFHVGVAGTYVFPDEEFPGISQDLLFNFAYKFNIGMGVAL